MAASFWLATASDIHAEPMGTGFTYQGQLKTQGIPLDGDVDLLFSLFDAESGGMPLDELTVANVLVANGLFTAEPDFGSSLFDGRALWVEIAVRYPHDPTDTAPFVTLSPRQAVTATPYALQTRGLFVDDDGEIGIGTTSPSSALHVEDNGLHAIYANNAYRLGHGIHGLASSSTGRNYGVYGESMSDEGYGIHGRASAETGNASGVYGYSNSPTGRGVYGFVGPTGGVNYGVYGHSNSTHGHGVVGFHGINSGPGIGVKGRTASPDGYAGYFEGGRNYFEGKVGFGTDDPDYPIHVESDAFLGICGRTSATNGSAVYGSASAVSGETYGGRFISSSEGGCGVKGTGFRSSGVNYGVQGHTASDDGYAGYFTGGKNYFEGRVGIGTDAPEYPLHVESSGSGAVHGEMSGAVGSGVHGVAHNTAAGLLSGVKGDAFSTTGRGVWGVAASTTGVNHGVYGMTFSNAGYGIHGHSVDAAGYAGYFEGGRNYFEGNVGIGTDTPDVKLDLSGSDANIRLQESGGSPYVELGDSSIQRGYLQWFSATNRLLLYASAHAYPIAIGPTGTGGIFVDTEANNSNVGIGTESPAARLQIEGTADVDPLRVRVDGITKFAVKRTGRTNVGSNNLPAFQLEVSGEGTAGKPGGGSWSISSDRRLKRNIRDLEGSLDRLLQLHSVSFEYKDPEAINELPGRRIGMIAQEVEEVFPDWVSVGGHGYKILTFRGFEALAVDALRELREEKDRQLREKEQQIAQLERQVTQMQGRLARLESMLISQKEDTQ
jgi:hypothetical protein